jgi:hypothetical protein
MVWNEIYDFPDSIQLGMSSSQLTNSIIFQRGGSSQPDEINDGWYIRHGLVLDAMRLEPCV